MNENLISQRRRYFQYFVNHLISIPVIRASLIFYDFLTVSDDKEFKKKKEMYDTEEQVTNYKQTKNLEGLLYSKFNKDLSKQNKIVRDYVNINELLISKLILAYDDLKIDFEKISLSLEKISNIYSQLKSISEEYFDPKPITDCYSSFENLNKEWSNCYKKMTNTIELDFKEFFHYYQMELDVLKPHIVNYQDCKEEYIKYSEELNNKKEKLFNSKKWKNWEVSEENLLIAESLVENKSGAFNIMCHKETKYELDLKRKLGVICYSLVTDFMKLRNYTSKRIRNHCTELSGRNNEIIADAFSLVKILHMNAINQYPNDEKDVEFNDENNEKVNLDYYSEGITRGHSVMRKNKSVNQESENYSSPKKSLNFDTNLNE